MFAEREACSPGGGGVLNQSFLYSRKRAPAVECGMVDTKAEVEVFNGMQTKKVLYNDPKNKKEPIDTIRDDQVRENGVCMSAAADDSLYPDRMIDSPTGNKVYRISFIGSMGMAGMGSTTIKTGLHFRIKTCHKRVKERFRRRFYMNQLAKQRALSYHSSVNATVISREAIITRTRILHRHHLRHIVVEGKNELQEGPFFLFSQLHGTLCGYCPGQSR